SLCAPGPEEGSCNVIATLRHDQSATTESHRISRRKVRMRPESPCRTIAGGADHVLARESLRRFRTSAFCPKLLHPITLCFPSVTLLTRLRYVRGCADQGR